MAKDPAFLFYPESFLGGISDLTMEERGQYITLLCYQHQKGVVSEKTIRLSVGSVSVDVMKKFIKDENGDYYNDRLRHEIEKRSKFAESRKENGKKGGRPKAYAEPNGLPYAEPYGLATNNLPINRNRNTNKDINTVEKRDRGSGGKGKTLAVQPKPNTLTDNLNLLQTVEMHNGLPPGSAATLAKVFYEIQSSTGNLEGKTIKEYQMHFSNWARKQAQAIKANTTSKAETVQDTFKRWEAQLSQNPEAFYQQALSSYHE